MNRWIFCFFLLLWGQISLSQEMEIRGTVIDTNIFMPVYGAKAYLINIGDSVIIDYQNTSQKGEFHFTIPISNYRLFIAHPDYSEKEFVFVGSLENHIFDLGEIQLDDESYNLEEIAVYAYKEPMYYKGDTLIYVADSFATQYNAVVEDLLKQLPGIEVESDGSITSQGKEISKVYVDGDEFFGSDPTIATKNLAAKSIDRVQVYEVEQEDGLIGDEKLQILDLKLKDNAKKGWFTKVNVATDLQQFHEGQVLFNRFSNNQKVFVFGLGSNTLNSSISRADAAAAGISGNLLGGNSNSGYPQTFRAGVLFNQKVNNKLKFEGNYLFSDSRIHSTNEKNTQYLLPDTTYFSVDSTVRFNASQSHDLSLNFNIAIDSSQTLQIAPKVGVTSSNSSNDKTTDYLNEEGDFMRRATNKSENESTSYNLSMRILYNKLFARPKRRLNLSDNISYNQNKGENNLNYFDYFYFSDLTENEILQLKENATNNFSNTFIASFTEPLNDVWSLNFDYELYNNLNNQNKYSYDNDGVDFSILDSLTSNVFHTSRLQNKLGISTTYNSKQHILSVGVRERNLRVLNENLFTGDKINQDVYSTLPFMTYRYRIAQNSSFSTRITTNSSLPSISYLSPARDNTNPNNILEGNESLKPNYTISASTNYMLFKRISEVNFNAGLSARYTFNDFARSLSYDSLGRSISVYENLNTFNNISARTGMSFPIYKRIIKMNPSFNYTNSNQNNIVDGVNNITNTHNFTPQVRLTVYNDFIDFNSTVRWTEQRGINSTNPKLNIKNTIWNFANELTLHLPGKIDFKTTANYYSYSNLSQEFNSDFLILNSSISKRLGKYDQWEIGVEGYDLLNKNTQISRTLTANTIVDSRDDIVSRYFLFRVVYSFNSTFRINQ